MKKLPLLTLAAILLMHNGGYCFDSSEEPLLTMNPNLPKIAPGITRAEVETLYTFRDGGPQSPNSTRYYRSPKFIVEVPYDQKGGTWSAQNRVNGPVIVTIGPRHDF